MLILLDLTYKNIIPSELLKYLVELNCLDYLLDEKLIDEKMYEKLNIDFYNSHIGKK